MAYGQNAPSCDPLMSMIPKLCISSVIKKQKQKQNQDKTKQKQKQKTKQKNNNNNINNKKQSQYSHHVSDVWCFVDV